QRSLSQDGQGKSDCGEEQGKTPRAGGGTRELFDGNGVETNQGTAERQVLLVRDGSEVANGSCDSGEQGRGLHQGKHRRGVRALQQAEGRQDADALLTIPCPGCPKCEPGGGFVLRRGSWRCTSSWEPILMLAKSDHYFADGDAVKTPPAEATV